MTFKNSKNHQNDEMTLQQKLRIKNKTKTLKITHKKRKKKKKKKKKKKGFSNAHCISYMQFLTILKWFSSMNAFKPFEPLFYSLKSPHMD